MDLTLASYLNSLGLPQNIVSQIAGGGPVAPLAVNQQMPSPLAQGATTGQIPLPAWLQGQQSKGGSNPLQNMMGGNSGGGGYPGGISTSMDSSGTPTYNVGGSMTF